ncbi:hypothetical protein Poli38472_003531 [Pythium oligandrum]|uniref:Fe2OG dioxygenase domain-containing protein n=1 Tax=Pythium oligandrum TaxID=41045 RepID=A0A8K1C6P7_PYTOL|nr:hypothetical protein Poli38472_003531 [Pythium oligandrum]|eukprot:TMW57606.1 hypothetical protein Poli38472_003531 [Pythium oligandrum]
MAKQGGRSRSAKAPNKPTTTKQTKSSSWSTTQSLLLAAVVVVIAVGVSQYGSSHANVSSDLYIPRSLPVNHKRFDIVCHMKKKSPAFIPGCHKVGKQCGRALRDQFVTPEEVVQLREIAEVGMANRSCLGGPTIMDINTGFVKDGDGLVNIYQSHPKAAPIPRFTAEQFDLYRRTIEKIRLALIEEFQLEHLYFTAPTFITRIVGNASWEPTEIHDEYWHPHVDKDNTRHYDYSGLLYLSDYGLDFTGGLFAFIDKKSEQVVEPARGRLMMFTSSKENLHQVRRVETGTRYVMSMWFTCDERRRFKNFLDGKMHVHFKRTDS